MNNVIREESGVHLLKPRDFHLFDVEPFLKKRKGWSRLRVPEIVLWNEKEMYVIEVKKSVPNKTHRPSGEKLERLRNCIKEKYNHILIHTFNNFCHKLYEKYLTIIVALGEDVRGLFLKDLTDEVSRFVENTEGLMKLKINKLKSIKLILIVPELPAKLVPEATDFIRQVFWYKIRPCLPRCEFVVMNLEMAIEKGLAAEQEGNCDVASEW